MEGEGRALGTGKARGRKCQGFHAMWLTRKAAQCYDALIRRGNALCFQGAQGV